MVRRNTRYLVIAGCAMTFVFLRLLSIGRAQQPSFQSLNGFSSFGKDKDPSFPPDDANAVDPGRFRVTPPNNIVLRPDVETALRLPEPQTQQGPLEHEAPPPYANKSLAITTTVLHPDPTLPIWLDYHLRRAAVILIFMDDPAERPIFERLIQGRSVVLLDGSDAEHQLTPESGIIYRQDANNEKAIQFARSNNITWLMHIDPDELFYEQGDQSWETDTNIGHIRFTNHEAVFLPYEIANFFPNCTIFRSDNQSETMRAYYYGKSAVRITPGVSSYGPHKFKGFQGEDRYVRRPMILHYPTPTFDRWVAKYTHYGNFSGNWYDSTTPNPVYPFMIGSRDHVQAALRSGNWTAAREYYISQIPDPSTVEDRVRTGDLLRITPFDGIEL
jgi:hypothetical protein